MKKFLVVILGMVLLAAVGCGSEQKQADGKLPVVASFYPMADFTIDRRRSAAGRYIDR